jgi:transposase
LIAAGERVVRVAPRFTGRARRVQRTTGKSDRIDALAVARAVVSEGVERFPVAFLDEDAMEIRLLSDHRDDLVAERTRMQNRLRWHLVTLCPELESEITERSLGRDVVIAKVDRKLRAFRNDARARVAREELVHIRVLSRQARALERELTVLVKAHRPALLAETGCGALTAAALIGRVAGAERFRTDAQFARQAGVAPIPVSSGKRDRYRLHRGGDRQLNRALHVIAITRVRLDPATRAFYERRLQRGDSRREALRVLKRHLARRFHRLLMAPVSANRRPVRVSVDALINPACLT